MGPTAIARLLVLAGIAIPWIHAAQADDLDKRFTGSVLPFVNRYCAGCHSGKTPAAQFDLHSYTTLAAVIHDYPRWNLVLEKLSAGEMPPKVAPQPPEDARKAVIGWVQAVRTNEAR